MLVHKFDRHVDNKAAFYNPAKHGIPAEVYGALAMAGEAGETAGKIKKLWRDADGVCSEERKAAILSELGDVLWYLTYTAHAFGATLADVMNENVRKLNDRHGRGVTGGDGDHR